MDDLEITRRISPVAVCASRASRSRFSASVRRFSRARGDVRARAPLASTFPFGGFTRRPIAIDDRLDEGLRLGKLGRGDGDVLPLDPNRRTL